MKLRNIVKTLAFAGAATALSACGGPEVTDGAETGANLTLDYFGDTDVVGFHMTLTRVACDANDAFEPATLEFNVDLLDGIMPGKVQLLEQRLNPASRHLGSDLFVSLDPGCYDIEAAPASAFDGDDWTPSEDCQVASTAADAPVNVQNGRTAEPPLLISQCVGDELGALDTPVALNVPPIVSVEILGNKFAYECQPLEVCATAWDENDDPIELTWNKDSGPNPFSVNTGDLELIGYESGHRIWRQCTTITNRFVGNYDWTVTVYDLGKRGGATVRMEDLVAPATSRFSLQFPTFVNWIEDPLCFDDAGDLVLAPGADPIERAAGCNYTTSEEYYCSNMFEQASPGSRALVCPGGDFDPAALYPDCN